MNGNAMDVAAKKTPAALARKYSTLLRDLAPVLGLILVTVVFTITTKGKLVTVDNLQSLLNQTIVTALVALGAVFVFGAGSLDMSVAGCVCISAVLACMAAIPTGSLLVAFAVCMGVSLLLGLFKGLFTAYVEVPTFIVTIVLNMIISAVVLVIMGKETTLYLRSAVPEIPALTFGEMTAVNLVTLASFFILCVVLFSFTGLGRRVKLVGGNPKSARQSGINVRTTKIWTFIIGAVGVGLAAFILLIRTRTVGNTTGSTLGTDVMVALVLGGMPISGGPRSRITAGLFGAMTITVLNSGLTIMGISTGMIQIVRGIVFLAIVFVASWSYRTKLLPR